MKEIISCWLFLDNWWESKYIIGVYYKTTLTVFFKVAVFCERNGSLFSDKKGLEHF